MYSEEELRRMKLREIDHATAIELGRDKLGRSSNKQAAIDRYQKTVDKKVAK